MALSLMAIIGQKDAIARVFVTRPAASLNLWTVAASGVCARRAPMISPIACPLKQTDASQLTGKKNFCRRGFRSG
jgi:hypothetical protein